MLNIRKTKLFIKRMPKLLLVTNLATLFVLLVKITVLNGIPEIMPYGYEAGIVFENLMLSYLGSFIFYLVIVHKKEIDLTYRQQSILNPKLSKIVHRCKDLIDEISKQSGNSFDFDSLNCDEFLKAAKALDVHKCKTSSGFLTQQSKGEFASVSLIEFIFLRYNQTMHQIDSLLDSRLYLDDDLVNILLDIKDSHFYQFLALFGNQATFGGFRVSNPFQDSAFVGYYDACKNLKAYMAD